MKQTQMGTQRYFGMKADIVVDATSGISHRQPTTAVNVTDITRARALVQVEELATFDDADYRGVRGSMNTRKAG